MNIEIQGQIKVESFNEIKRYKKLSICMLNLKAKRIEINAAGSAFQTEDTEGTPEITLGTIPATLFKDKRYKSDLTVISFPEYKGWEIFSSNTSKYNVYICFMRNIWKD